MFFIHWDYEIDHNEGKDNSRNQIQIPLILTININDKSNMYWGNLRFLPILKIRTQNVGLALNLCIIFLLYCTCIRKINVLIPPLSEGAYVLSRSGCEGVAVCAYDNAWNNMK